MSGRRGRRCLSQGVVSAVGILNDAQIDQHLAQRPHWRRRGELIVRELRFRDFDEAVSFVSRLSAVIEHRSPYPEIVLHDWNEVRLVVVHANRAGITSAAFEIADELDAVVTAFETNAVSE
jgi:4a-hydroxytetrahydrobiopterin dehydratase